MTRVSRTGFTLIELLIVVAIIGILASIAIPNFLQAQTRARVSRAQSDIRSLSVALESYQIDNNVYPPGTFATGQGVGLRLPSDNGADLASHKKNPTWPFGKGADGSAGGWTGKQPMLERLTSPIAFLANLPLDPFFSKEGIGFGYGTDGAAWILTSGAADRTTHDSGNKTAINELEYAKKYWDKQYDLKSPTPYYRQAVMFSLWNYDPSNGVQSAGDILRVGP